MPGLITLYIIFLVFAAAAARLYKDIVGAEASERKDEENIEENKKNSLAGKLEALADEERQARENELMVMNLFEITRKMSEKLKFLDIFNVFSSFLKSNFSFRKCELLVLNRYEPGFPRLDRVYSVWQEGFAPAAKQVSNYDKLIRHFSRFPAQKIHASKKSERKFLEEIGAEAPEVETFTAIPLSDENAPSASPISAPSASPIGGPSAILTVENLPTEELEKFLILSMQFALEIKKVLLYETVEKLAITDSLTGLYLRRYFYDRLDEELSRSRRYKLEFAFLMIDIDDFKHANDTYGHLVGDVVLKELGAIIKDSVREIDLVSRYGGEEFAIVLPETGPEGAMLAAERIRKKVELHAFRAYDETLKITISTGVSMYPRDASETDPLIERADSAMYEAKKSGKNVVCRFKE